MTAFVWVAAAVLVLIAGVLYRRRLGALKAGSAVTDSMIARIESFGRVEVDEPLDLEEAAAEDEKFWSETWDEPEEF